MRRYLLKISLIFVVVPMVLPQPPSYASSSIGPQKPASNQQSASSTEDSPLPQNRSFEMASGAMNYLGFYLMNYKAFGDQKFKEKLKKSFDDCLSNESSCSDDQKAMILSAALNYNLGKELRRTILENNTNQENMKSLMDTVQDQSVVSRKESLKPFKLDPDKIGKGIASLSAKEAREQEILGENFINEYKAFIHTYAATTPEKETWHYVAAKSASDDKYVLMTPDETSSSSIHNNKTTAFIDKDKLAADTNSQERKIIKEKVDELEKELQSIQSHPDGSLSNVDKLRLDALALSAPASIKTQDGKVITGDDVSKVIAKDINTIIDKAIDEKKRDLASKGNTNTVITNAEISMPAFEKFLDEIWPPSASKQKSMAQSTYKTIQTSKGRFTTSTAESAGPNTTKRAPVAEGSISDTRLTK